MKYSHRRHHRGGCGSCGGQLGGYGFQFTKSDADLKREQHVKDAFKNSTKKLGSMSKKFGHALVSQPKKAWGSMKRSTHEWNEDRKSRNKFMKAAKAQGNADYWAEKSRRLSGGSRHRHRHRSHRLY